MSVLNKISREFKKKLKKTLWRKIECEPDYNGRMVFFTGIARRRYIDTFYIARSAIYYQFSKKMREMYERGRTVEFRMWIGLGKINLNRTGLYWLDINPEDKEYLDTYYQKIENLYNYDGAFMPGAYGINEFTLEPSVDDCLCPCIEFSGRYEDLTGYPEYEDYEGNERNEEQPQHINTNETFKSKCCVLCLDENTTPTILFCSCGHLCLCEKCDEVYAKKECPVCRVKSEIKRKI